jgi:phenylalanyl-tRNA synthetase alpha chain
MLKDKSWKSANFKKYNVEANVEPIYTGKYQPYKRFLDLIRKRLIAMGFEEMNTSLTTTEFYNFDVLFQPQNHPARTWTDTYTLKTPPTGKLPDNKIIDKIKNAHENGGNTESIGWGYKWNPDIAMKLMPVAQGTAFSARKMTEGVNVPGRYFALARVYRPDVLDATHLNEFNQLEGFVVADEIAFKHLLGLLANFAKEIAGAEEIKFYPDYYPFTEPSVQISAKHPTLGWVELGGAGMFRPEFTESLGVKERCIAWGLGIDRLAMFNLGIKDIRELFSSRIEWLRDKPIVEKI